MPSPIGHALAGIAAGWSIAPPRSGGASARARAAVYGFAAAAADLDLLFGAHSGPTHGVGAAAMAGILAWVLLRSRGGPHAVRIAGAIALAYATHTLLDWLGTDTSPPIGIMALWPFSRGYYESHLHVFMAISRRYWLPEFWTYNLRALARELLIFVPIVWIAMRYRQPTRLEDQTGEGKEGRTI
jgi:membrane-bound metal-dependent hydrolase YbcI (DUF457 family)